MQTVELGERLLALRRGRRLTLAQLEEETGISSSFLSIVEKGRSDISISRLLRLADFYEIALDELVSTDGPPGPDSVLVVREGEGARIHTEGVEVRVLIRHHREGIGANVSTHAVGSQVIVSRQPGPETLLYVLDGCYEVSPAGGTTVCIGRGDTLVFRGDVDYAVVCVEGEPARMLAVFATPR